MAARYGGLSHAGSLLPPLNVALLAAVAREAGHTVSLLDCEAQLWSPEESAKRILELTPDLVGVTATTTSVVPAGKLLGLIRQGHAGVRTCIGGVHVSCAAEETLDRFPALDTCVVGEGERTLLELASAIEHGGDLGRVAGLVFRRGDSYVRTAPRPYLTSEELDRLPWPAWDLLPDLARTYRPALHSFRRLPCSSLITSRGCPGRCTFCDRTVFGNRIRGFSAGYLLGMVRHLVERYGIREIIIHDDNFLTMRKRLIEFCERLIDTGPRVAWSCNGRVDMVTPEILALMRRAGCLHIAYGIESGSQAILDVVDKGVTLEQIRKAVAWTREAGIEPRGYFLIGVPGETRETLAATHDFLMTLPLSDIQMSLFTPHPGTELTSKLRASGKFSPDWERDGGWHVTYVPDGLTAADLAETQKRCLHDFYLRPRTVLRYANRFAWSPGIWKPLVCAAWQFLRYRGGS